MTTTATQITTQIAQARELMQTMIQLGFGIETRERQERRINALKAKLQAATPDLATAGDTVRIIDGPDAGAVFVVEVAFASGTVGVRTCNGELVWFARPTVCKTSIN